MLGPGLWALAASSTAFAVWIGAGVGGSTVVVYVDDLATAGAALLAAGLCALAARRHTGRLRLVWTLFAAACAAWTIGESAWAAYELSGDVPVSSWADVAYLAALPLAAAALLVHPALQGRVLARSRSLVDGLLLAAGVFFLGWALVLEPVGRTADLGSVDGLVTLAYPLGDVVIVFLVVLVIRGLTDVHRLDLWCVLGGLMAITCSDAVYSYLAGVEDFATGGVIDTGWFTGYLAIGLGALVSQPASIAPRTPADTDSLSSAAVLAHARRPDRGDDPRADRQRPRRGHPVRGPPPRRPRPRPADTPPARPPRPRRHRRRGRPDPGCARRRGGGTGRRPSLDPEGVSMARRRRQQGSEALVVASLTVLATGIAVYDLLLLALGLQ
jgi:hypothetical protein